MYNYVISAGKDIIWMDKTDRIISCEDLNKLDELNWFQGDDVDGYNFYSGWGIYV